MFDNKILELFSVLAIIFPAFLLIFTFRGFFKALIANVLGDSTASDNGFLSLNPFVHIDIVGFLSILFVVFFLGGLLSGYVPLVLLFLVIILVGARFTIPVPINENNFKYYKLGLLFMTILVPVLSFLIALIFMYCIKYFPISLVPKYVYTSFIDIFKTIMEFSIFFGVLDLIPLPPFDGGRIIKFLLPIKYEWVYYWLEKYSFFIFLIVFFMPVVSNYFFGMVHILTFFVKYFLTILVF